MLAGAANIDWEDPRVAIPSFLTIVTIPLTYSIATGLSFGLISFAAPRIATGRGRRQQGCCICCRRPGSCCASSTSREPDPGLKFLQAARTLSSTSAAWAVLRPDKREEPGRTKHDRDRCAAKPTQGWSARRRNRGRRPARYSLQPLPTDFDTGSAHASSTTPSQTPGTQYASRHARWSSGDNSASPRNGLTKLTRSAKTISSDCSRKTTDPPSQPGHPR